MFHPVYASVRRQEASLNIDTLSCRAVTVAPAKSLIEPVQFSIRAHLLRPVNTKSLRLKIILLQSAIAPELSVKSCESLLITMSRALLRYKSKPEFLGVFVLIEVQIASPSASEVRARQTYSNARY